MWPSAWDPTAWKVIGAYMAFELALMRLVPGKTFTAMVTATGHVPKYTANGMQCYALSIAALMYLMHEGTLAPGAVYDLFGKLLSSMNVFALLFCCALMLELQLGWLVGWLFCAILIGRRHKYKTTDRH